MIVARDEEQVGTLAADLNKVRIVAAVLQLDAMRITQCFRPLPPKLVESGGERFTLAGTSPQSG